ncbi:hypothetical protein DAEQUDRAFT_553798 [Daedalea quercina L-15889]|uniref:Uncharacterized protein n=1 Tax=Daedalea quercina L-15889 TaxID=1314783 RepID=A0A165T4H2_9APHY|nr:hypothetical protein DAEQUDRAFT_553798 [Daedalea quercina L-15889]
MTRWSTWELGIATDSGAAGAGNERRRESLGAGVVAVGRLPCEARSRSSSVTVYRVTPTRPVDVTPQHDHLDAHSMSAPTMGALGPHCQPLQPALTVSCRLRSSLPHRSRLDRRRAPLEGVSFSFKLNHRKIRDLLNSVEGGRWLKNFIWCVQLLQLLLLSYLPTANDWSPCGYVLPGAWVCVASHATLYRQSHVSNTHKSCTAAVALSTSPVYRAVFANCA